MGVGLPVTPFTRAQPAPGRCDRSPCSGTAACTRGIAPSRVLSCLFRRLFLEFLRKAFDDHQLHFFFALHQLQDSSAFSACLAPLRQAEWVVYAKPPFAGPKQVLDYVGRYTHRVAISNDRLLDIEDGSGAVPLQGLSQRQPAESDDPVRR